MVGDDRPHVHPPSTRIRLRRSWDATMERTALLRPAGCEAALFDWRPERWPADGGIPAEIARALAAALTSLGTVMGRMDGSDTAGPYTTLIPPPRRTVLAILRDCAMRRPKAQMLWLTHDAGDAATLLEHGWPVQCQAVLVLSPGAALEPAIEALRYRWDWRGFQFAPSMCVLVAPSNDGDGAMIASSSIAGLAYATDLLNRTFKAAGFLVGCERPGRRPPEGIA